MSQHSFISNTTLHELISKMHFRPSAHSHSRHDAFWAICTYSGMSRDFTCVVSGIVMLCLASILLVAVQMFKLEPMFLKVNPVAMYANPSGSFAVPDSEFESVFHSIVANGSATIKSRVLEHMLQVYSSIYQPLRITGFHLTEEERSELSSNALTYGEITIPAFDSLMLDLIDSSEKAFNCKDTGGDNLTVIECDVSVSMTPRRVFMDLGSGTSKTVLHAFLSGLFTESIGIEVASTRVKQSCEVLELVSKRPELTQYYLSFQPHFLTMILGIQKRVVLRWLSKEVFLMKG